MRIHMQLRTIIFYLTKDEYPVIIADKQDAHPMELISYLIILNNVMRLSFGLYCFS